MSKQIKIKCNNCNKYTFWDGKSDLQIELIVSPNANKSIGCSNCNSRIIVTNIVNKILSISGKSSREIDNKWFDWLILKGYEVIDNA